MKNCSICRSALGLTFAIVSLLITAHSFAVDYPTAVEADIAISKALTSGDARAAAAVIDDRFTATDRFGVVHTKKDFLDHLSPEASFTGGQESQLKTYGAVAFLTGPDRLPVVNENVYFLRIYVKGSAGWKAFAYTQSTIGKGAPSLSDNPVKVTRPACENPCKRYPFEPDTPEVREVAQSYAELANAMATNDMVEYERHLAPELMLVSRRGEQRPRSASVANHQRAKETDNPRPPAAIKRARITVFGDSAVMELDHAYLPPDPPTPEHIVQIWAKADGLWRMVYSQHTEIVVPH